MKINPKNIILIFSFLILNNCGYHLRGFGDTLPEDTKTIAIINFENETFEADIGPFLLQSLAEEFSKSRRLRIVDDSDADLIVSGIISSFSENPVSFSSSDQTTDYRIEMKVDVTLRRRDEGEVIWKGKGLSEIEDYSSEPGNIDITERNRNNAKRVVADELAELIYDRVFEGF